MLKKSVGLLILTEIPGWGLVAALRERGWFNFEKMATESWAGGYQVTVHGKLEDGEDFSDALERERREELGPAFADLSQMRKGIILVHEIKGSHKHIQTFAQKVDYCCLSRIRLAADSGCLRFIQRSYVELISDLGVFPKETGVPDRSVIAMFPDEKEAVASAFKYFT